MKDLIPNGLNTIDLYTGTFDELPESLAVNNSAGLLLNNYMLPDEQPDKSTINDIITADQGTQLTVRKQTAESILINNPDTDTAIEQARDTLSQPITTPTAGSLVARDLGDPEATNISDYHILLEDTKNDTLHNLGFNASEIAYEDYMNSSSPEVQGETESILDTLLAGESTREAIINFINDRSIPTPLNLAEAALDVQTSIIKDQLVKDATVKDMLAYASMTPIDAQAEVDFMNAVQIVFSTDNFEERGNRLSQWDSEMRAKYDDDYYYQLAAFMAKEGIIDGVPLALALRNPSLSKKLLAKEGANIWGRLGAVVKRASFVGITGGAAQSSINSYVYDDPNIGEEVLIRAGGELVAEALIPGGKAIKGLIAGAIASGKGVFKPEIQQLVSTVDPLVIDQVNKSLNPLATSTALTSQDSLLSVTARALDTEGSISQYQTLANATKQALETNPVPVGNLSTSEVLLTMSGKTPTRLEEEIVAHGFTDQVIGDVTSRQKKVTDILDYYIDSNLKTLDYRPLKLNTNMTKGVLKRAFLDPEQYLSDTAKDAFDVYNLQSLYRSTFSKATDAALKGIKDKDIDAVYKVRLDYEQEWADGMPSNATPMELSNRGLSEDQIDAFYSIDRLSRFAIIQADKMAVKAAKERGDLMYQDRLVRVIEELDDDTVKIKELTKSRADVPLETIVKRSELNEVDKVSGFIPYHTPRRYEGVKWHISVLDPTTGAITRTHALKNLPDTKATFEEFNKKVLAEGKVAFYDRWVPEESAFEFGMQGDTMSLVSTLDKEGIQNIRDALLNSGRSEEEIDNLLFSFDKVGNGAVISKKLLGRRSKTGLLGADGKPAQLKKPSEAFSEYLLQVGALPKSDYKRTYIRQFEKDFRPVLDPSKPWSQEIRSIPGLEDMTEAAKEYQTYIRTLFNTPDPLTKWYNKGMENSISKLSKKHPGLAKSLENNVVLSKLTDAQEFGRWARINTSRIIFYGNTGSFLSQTVPSVVTNVGARIFSNPSSIAGGFTDMGQAMGAALLEQVRGNISKEGSTALKALRRSGYLSEIDIIDLADTLSGQSARIDKYGMFFIKNGESMNRAMSFYMARRDILKDLDKGTLKGIDGNAFKGVADDDEFLRLVTDRAQKFALNMTPAARLKVARGTGSVLLQYWSAPLKMANLLVSDRLSAKERVGLGISMFTLFGPASIPFMGDLLWAGDELAWAAQGRDNIDNRQLLTSTVKSAGTFFAESIEGLDIDPATKKLAIDIFTNKGAIESLTDGQIDLINRVTVSAMVKEQIGSMSEDITNAFPFISISKKIASEVSNLPEYFTHWYEAYEIYQHQAELPIEQQDISLLSPYQKQKEATAIALSQVLNASGRVVPMLGYIADIANNLPASRHVLNPELKDFDAGKFITRAGIQVGEDQVRPEDLLSLPLGITPKIKRDATEKFLDEKFWTDTVQSIEDALMEKYRNAKGYDAKRRALDNIYDEAYKVENALFVEWEGSLKRATRTSPDKPYRIGTLVKKWINKTEFIDNAQRFGVTSSSKGED